MAADGRDRRPAAAGRELLRLAGRDASAPCGAGRVGGALRRLHRLLHVVAVRPHRAGRGRHPGAHPGRAAVPGAPAARGPRRSWATTSTATARCSSTARCSIYEHRPRTCRTYDCRVFPAAGIDADDDKPAIATRARRWRFEHPDEVDRVEHEAVQAAAAYVAERDGSRRHRDPAGRPRRAVARRVLRGRRRSRGLREAAWRQAAGPQPALTASERRRTEDLDAAVLVRHLPDAGEVDRLDPSSARASLAPR